MKTDLLSGCNIATIRLRLNNLRFVCWAMLRGLCPYDKVLTNHYFGQEPKVQLDEVLAASIKPASLPRKSGNSQ